MVNLFGCERAVSAHIERKKSKLDFALPTCPTKEEINRIEKIVNETLKKNTAKSPRNSLHKRKPWDGLT